MILLRAKMPNDVTVGSNHRRSSAVVLNGLDERLELLFWAGRHSFSAGNEERFSLSEISLGELPEWQFGRMRSLPPRKRDAMFCVSVVLRFGMVLLVT